MTGLRLLSNVNRVLILSSDNPFDFHAVALLATVLKFLETFKMTFKISKLLLPRK